MEYTIAVSTSANSRNLRKCVKHNPVRSMLNINKQPKISHGSAYKFAHKCLDTCSYVFAVDQDQSDQKNTKFQSIFTESYRKSKTVAEFFFPMRKSTLFRFPQPPELTNHWPFKTGQVQNFLLFLIGSFSSQTDQPPSPEIQIKCGAD